METTWQRVESMHRWILENGGMIYFIFYERDLLYFYNLLHLFIITFLFMIYCRFFYCAAIFMQ